MIDYKNGENIEQTQTYRRLEMEEKEIAEQKEKAHKAADILFDPVSRPKHYAGQCSLECIEVLRLVFDDYATVHFCQGNVFKYLWRYKGKNGTEDLKKAKWYLDYAHRMVDSSEYLKLVCGDKQKQLEEMYGRIMGADYIWE